MRLEQYQPLSYYAPDTILVLSQEELDGVIDGASSTLAYAEAINAAAASLGYDPETKDSHVWCGGIKSIKVWLDGVSQADPTRLKVGVFSGRSKSTRALYVRQKRGWYVQIESHGVIA